ncbi:MAG TPA: hypothetical protein VF761_00590 [Gemmatimonadaceae bacterium]
MMRYMRRSAIGGVLLAIGMAPAARAQDAALLLGQRETTLLIVVHGDTVSARRGAGLVVPRASGWWRVGVDGPSIDYPELRARVYPRWRADSIRADSAQRWMAEHPDTASAPTADAPDSLPPREMNMHGEELGHEACFAHVVWAVPLGTLPALPDSLCAEGAEPAGEYSFTFVSPAILTMYAGITTDYSYNFTRGTIVATLDSAARHPLTSIGGRSYDDDAVDPDPALGVSPHDAAWAREAMRCNVEYNKGIREENDDTTSWDYVGTWIARTPGRWRYERYYANTSYVGRGHEESCVVRVPVPARITGWDRLTVPMPAIRKRVPKAMDAFTSPNGAVAVVLDSTGTRVFRLEKGALGRELASIPSVENPTMSQWATGGSVRRWEAELAPVLPEVLAVRPGGADAAKR